MTNQTTVAGRVKTSFGGLFVTAFSSIFVVVGIAIVVSSAPGRDLPASHGHCGQSYGRRQRVR